MEQLKSEKAPTYFNLTCTYSNGTPCNIDGQELRKTTVEHHWEKSFSNSYFANILQKVLGNTAATEQPKTNIAIFVNKRYYPERHEMTVLL